MFDEMTEALHYPEKFPKITTEFSWYQEGVYGAGAHMGTGKLGFDMVSKDGHNGMVMAN